MQPAHSGNYSCLVSNAVGAATSADAALNVVTTFPAADPVDTTFTLGLSLNVSPRVTAAQPDGKLLLGGNFLLLNQGQAQFGLARLNTDGSLDTTFKPGAIDPNGTVFSIAVQSDGKILIGGSFSSINGIARNRLARLNADGALDSTFTPSLASSNTVLQIGVGPDSRIVVHQSATSLARLNPDGALDPTWTPTTVSTGTIGTNPIIATTQAFDFQSDGKILHVVTGSSSPPNSSLVTNLVRLNTNGTLDTTFNTVALGINTVLRTLRVLADGRIMAATTGTGNIVQRLSPAGLFDSAVTLNPGVSSAITLAAFTPDGRTWLAGSFFSINGVGRNQLARLNADGSVDATYNPGTGVFASAGFSTPPTTLLLSTTAVRSSLANSRASTPPPAPKSPASTPSPSAAPMPPPS